MVVKEVEVEVEVEIVVPEKGEKKKMMCLYIPDMRIASPVV